MVNKKSIYLVEFIIGSILVLNGCNTTSKQSDAVHYFDLDSLMTEQLNVMLSKKVRLEKISLLDSKYDSVVFFPDSSQWAREFVIFQQKLFQCIEMTILQ